MPADHSDLELVVRHVAEERRIVARQRELIARLRAAGASTSGAEETLKAFEANLAIFEERERDLRQKGWGANAVMWRRRSFTPNQFNESAGSLRSAAATNRGPPRWSAGDRVWSGATRALIKWWPSGDRASEKLAKAGAAEARIDDLFVAGS
jgi:hypothetical protein